MHLAWTVVHVTRLSTGEKCDCSIQEAPTISRLPQGQPLPQRLVSLEVGLGQLIPQCRSACEPAWHHNHCSLAPTPERHQIGGCQVRQVLAPLGQGGLCQCPAAASPSSSPESAWVPKGVWCIRAVGPWSMGPTPQELAAEPVSRTSQAHRNRTAGLADPPAQS